MKVEITLWATPARYCMYRENVVGALAESFGLNSAQAEDLLSTAQAAMVGAPTMPAQVVGLRLQVTAEQFVRLAAHRSNSDVRSGTLEYGYAAIKVVGEKPEIKDLTSYCQTRRVDKAASVTPMAKIADEQDAPRYGYRRDDFGLRDKPGIDGAL